MSLRKYFDIELEDDETECGGTAYSGETVGDFVLEILNDEEDLTIEELNAILVDCGIKEIEV